MVFCFYIYKPLVKRLLFRFITLSSERFAGSGNKLLQLFHKIQYLNQEEINSIKTMLKAFVFQKDIQKQFS
ncbi:hypothetical protein SY27_12280 [Flavobacterium sp. 316]|nr:hypothetical protein SY27_12280 [Flavobacterium sp. 316]